MYVTNRAFPFFFLLSELHAKGKKTEKREETINIRRVSQTFNFKANFGFAPVSKKKPGQRSRTTVSCSTALNREWNRHRPHALGKVKGVQPSADRHHS